MKEYTYNIINDVYNWMISRKKNIEVRILKEKSSIIQPGDIIIFNNQDDIGKFVKAKVINKTIVNNINELLEIFDVSRMMPDHTEEDLKNLMKKIYGSELDKKQIVAFEFEYLSSDNDIKMIEYNNLTVKEYTELLNSVGWKIPSERLLKKSLENGLSTKYVLNNETIGMARLVTDGGYAGLIMDVVVKPKYHGNGYGTLLIESLINHVKEYLLDGEEMMLQLLSAPGKQNFYSRFGFKVKKEVAEDGMYMWLKK